MLSHSTPARNSAPIIYCQTLTLSALYSCSSSSTFPWHHCIIISTSTFPLPGPSHASTSTTSDKGCQDIFGITFRLPCQIYSHMKKILSNSKECYLQNCIMCWSWQPWPALHHHHHHHHWSLNLHVVVDGDGQRLQLGEGATEQPQDVVSHFIVPSDQPVLLVFVVSGWCL